MEGCVLNGGQGNRMVDLRFQEERECILAAYVATCWNEVGAPWNKCCHQLLCILILDKATILKFIWRGWLAGGL
jgi:hypothetical protein